MENFNRAFWAHFYLVFAWIFVGSILLIRTLPIYPTIEIISSIIFGVLALYRLTCQSQKTEPNVKEKWFKRLSIISFLLFVVGTISILFWRI